MPKFPDYLEPFRKRGEACLASGCVKDIEFSGSTYQIEVIDPKTQTDIWTFLQLDPKGNIQDCFCSCESDENSAGCMHIAAAYSRIFKDNAQPLHQRFNRSLWNKLCQLYADRLGTATALLKQEKPGQYYCSSASGKTIFYVRAKGKAAQAKLQQILNHRLNETEETSLKFSNLSPEEIALWRQGRPSSQLRYELSFWNDFAKWLMLLQDEGNPYQISFNYSLRGLPSEIDIHFPELEMGFYISLANLPFIIPGLASVDSPLKVHSNYEESIEKITYDKHEGALHIEAKVLPKAQQKKSKHHAHPNSIHIDKWIFIPDDGFYPKEQHGLLSTPVVKGKHVNEILNEQYKVVEHLLVRASIHDDPVRASYSISYDEKWNLHISCFVFKPGDLTKPDSRFFGEWAYLDNDGFYRLEGVSFPEQEKIVQAKHVSDFVTQNRLWLNTQEGFHTHIINIENQLIYNLGDDNRLRFDTHLDISEESEEHKDFGNWVYVYGQGFFSKTSPNITLPVHAGAVIDSHYIPTFIRMNQDELQLVPHFFSPKCPIIKAGLQIELDEEEMIHVTPHYDISPEYAAASLRFFDDVVYIPDEGFSILPHEMRLPEEFQHAMQVEKEDTDFFIEHELDNIRKYATSLDPRLYKPHKMVLTVESMEEATDLGKGWDFMKMSYTTDFGHVLVSKLWKSLQADRRYIFTEAGLIDLHDERFNWLRNLRKNRVDLKRNTVSLNTMEILRLDAFDTLQAPSADAKHSQHTRDLLRELREFIPPAPPDLSGLDSKLRPYQQVGVNWLWFLYHHSLSGLLCDDMGLGKTHQAMALLAAITNDRKKRLETTPDLPPAHFLVVCPTSVIYHWQDKLKEFLPGARVCTFHGIKRSLGDFHKEYDILLTSYGIWRNDNELLKSVFFEAAIFDEIQVAKNYNSQVYASLKNVRSKMRIGLTGTPIENRLRELKSLFDIVLPHYMPEETEYREFFVKPIEKMHEEGRKKLLSRFIKPFVTRRKKEDVLSDLPEKTEEIAHCALLPDQHFLYQQVLQQSREKLLDELKNDKNPIPYLHIFALLSALKQICNHPAVYLKQPQNYKQFNSGKWELFVELVKEARESQQKVVIFTQYLHMLDIFEDYLKEHGIGFATIRGSTVNRGEQVRNFNQNPKCEVFIGSLHAAGLGIDLTAGSVVIHYDRWWNAARENQATDRVHRIGQTRGVQVFKLVTKGTFEERIDALIAHKGRLMEEVVGVDEQQFIKTFDRNEIIQLLQDVDLSKENTRELISDEE